MSNFEDAVIQRIRQLEREVERLQRWERPVYIWQSYTVSWTAATTNPSIGNGILSGRYIRVGNLVIATIYLSFGSTSSVGSGIWLFSFPITPASDALNCVSGSWGINDLGTNNFNGFVRYGGATYITLPYIGSPFYVGANYPMTWASGDKLWAFFIYEAA